MGTLIKGKNVLEKVLEKSKFCRMCGGKLKIEELHLKQECKECGALFKTGFVNKEIKTHREIVMPEIVEFLKKNVKEGMKVLDVGHGYEDDFKKVFMERGIEYNGIDIGTKFNLRKETGEEIKEMVQTGNYYVGSMVDMNMFKDNQFDLVFCCHAFEHCLNPMKALQEMIRVSKKWIFIITPYHCDYQITDGDSDHLFVFTDLQMKKILKNIESLLKIDVYVQNRGIENQKDYNLISIAVVK